MQAKHGKVHKKLGMKLDYSTVGQMKITMLEYINEISNAFDKADPTRGGTKSSAAPAFIFNVDKDCKKINVKQTVELHHLVAKYIICYQAGQARHLYRNFIPHHKSERTRQ